MTPPRRRWSYSLRTLFVVVTLACAACGWFACQLKWVTDRQAIVGTAHELRIDAGRFRAPFPWMLKLLGERPVLVLFLGNGFSEEEVRRLQELFPETHMHERYLFCKPREIQVGRNY